MVRQHPEFELHDISESLKKRNIPGRRRFNIKDFKRNGNVSFYKQRGVHGERGLYLYKVVSLGQVLRSSVRTSSCLLDLAQQLLQDQTDATEASVLVWTESTLNREPLRWFSPQPQVQRIRDGFACWRSRTCWTEVPPVQLNEQPAMAESTRVHTLKSGPPRL